LLGSPSDAPLATISPAFNRALVPDSRAGELQAVMKRRDW
jgi:hypothetical protein